MINSLTGLRAVAALAVFLFHVSVVRLDDKRLNIDFLDFFLIHNGDFGVDIFFVLSGYVIALVYAKKFEHFEFKQYKRFVYARLIRMLPVHLFTMMMMIFSFHLIRSGYGEENLNSFNYEYRSIFLVRC